MNRERQQQNNPVEEIIDEEDLENPLENLELEAIPEDFIACTVCQKSLSQEEKVLNTQFVNEGMAAERDITIFPVCFKCNLSNLIWNSRSLTDKKYLDGCEETNSPIFYPTYKLGENLTASQEIKPAQPLRESIIVEDYFEQLKPKKIMLGLNTLKPISKPKDISNEPKGPQTPRVNVITRTTRTSGSVRTIPIPISTKADKTKTNRYFSTTNQALLNNE